LTPQAFVEAFYLILKTSNTRNRIFFNSTRSGTAGSTISRYSNIQLQEAVQNINASQQNAHTFLKEATWLIITLGSSFSYRLTKSAGIFKSSRLGRAGGGGSQLPPRSRPVVQQALAGNK